MVSISPTMVYPGPVMLWPVTLCCQSWKTARIWTETGPRSAAAKGASSRTTKNLPPRADTTEPALTVQSAAMAAVR